MKNLLKITNDKIINYIESKGYMPQYEDDEAAYFIKGKQLTQLLEDDYIENVLFYNHQVRG